jgi:prepilin-type N-terminal cleavage/methylation domain-containing protein
VKVYSHRVAREEAGYSLIEVVVAILLLSIAIIPMVSMFDAGLRAAVLGSNYDTARTSASEELEEIKALPFEDVVSNYAPSGSPHTCSPPLPSVISDCRVQTDYAIVGNSGVTLNPDARAMIRVRVTTEWDGGGNSYTTVGIVSKDTV